MYVHILYYNKFRSNNIPFVKDWVIAAFTFSFDQSDSFFNF